MLGFDSPPTSLLGLLLAAAFLSGCLTVIMAYRREAGPASRRVRLLAAACRLLALGLVLLLLLEPVLVKRGQLSQRSVVLVLVDCSLSLGLEDNYPDPAERAGVAAVLGRDPTVMGAAEKVRRIDLVRAVLGRSGLLPALREEHEIQAYVFGETLTPVALAPRGEGGEDGEGGESGESGETGEADLSGIYPRGAQTRLGAALGEAIRRLRGRPVAGVIVLSDGRATGGLSVAAGAAEAVERRIPVYTLGFGSVNPPRNLALTELSGPETARVGDRLELIATLRQVGCAGESVLLELGENGVPVGTRRVELGPEAQGTSRVTLFREAQAPGPLTLSVTVLALPGETTETDNARSLTVNVSDQTVRLLLVSGWPSLEYRALKDFARRQHNLDLGVWLQSARPGRFTREGNHPLEALPGGKELATYDLVLLLDPDPEALGAEFIADLEEYVSRGGGGLVFVAGPQHAARALQTGRLGRLLPVELGHDGLRLLQERPPSLTEAIPVEVLRPEHFALRLAEEREENRRRWQSLPGVYWFLPTDRARPGAVVLALPGDPGLRGRFGRPPLIAAWQAGAGRAFFIASDESWRWRGQSVSAYRRFWHQVINAVRRGAAVPGEGPWLATDRARYRLGERVTVNVQTRGAALERPEALALGPAPPAVTVPLAAAGPDRLVGSFVPDTAGPWRLWLPGPGREAEPPGDARRIEVELPAAEFREPTLDRERLAALARLTGGEYLPPDRAAEIAERLGPRATIITEEERLPLLERLDWAAGVFAVLLLLLTAEWLLRKRHGLA